MNLDNLNERQKEAAMCTEGPLLILAGAGSGKTATMTHRIAYLIEKGISPYKILAVTFTNKAAAEMRQRVERLTGVCPGMWILTFHSMGLRILRENYEAAGYEKNFVVYDTVDQKALLKNILKDLNVDPKEYPVNYIGAIISKEKEADRSPQEYLEEEGENFKSKIIYSVYREYQSRLRKNNAMDFDDLLRNTLHLLRDYPDILGEYQRRFLYIMVDEYQDTNHIQYEIIKMLAAASRNLCVVGDDDQCIYQWRGADIRNILDFEKDFKEARVIKLEQNYRSCGNILSAAHSVIRNNKGRKGKKLWTEQEDGHKIVYTRCDNDKEEASYVARQIQLMEGPYRSFDDFAVLYRTNAQSRTLEEALRKRNIPYTIYGGLSFYQRKEVKDAIAYFRLATNPDDDEALRRIINYPTRGIGDTTVGKLQAAAIRGNVSIWHVVAEPEKYALDVNSGTKNKLKKFFSQVSAYIECNEDGKSAYELAELIIRDTDLISSLQKNDTPENISKIENLNELLNAVQEFTAEREEQGEEHTSLLDFLSEISLDTDEGKNSPDGMNVKLMTAHASKGLEFKNVIIVGVEEDLFPATMSSDSIYGIEEERRLLYVAITRAETTCLLTYAKQRYKNGQQKECVMSRFLRDIDPTLLSTNASAATNFASPALRDEHQGTYRPNSLAEHRKAWSEQTQRNSYKAAPTPPVASTSAHDGEFAIHTVDELHDGSRIEHSRFGFGTIAALDTSGADAKAIVKFDEIGQKVLLLKFAKFKIID